MDVYIFEAELDSENFNLLLSLILKIYFIIYYSFNIYCTIGNLRGKKFNINLLERYIRKESVKN